METKKKLRKDLDALAKQFVAFRENTQIAIKELREKYLALAKSYGEAIDYQTELKAAIDNLLGNGNEVTGKEAAKLLGWSTDYVSASFLEKHNILFFKDSNGCLHIDKASLMDYIEKKEDSTNKN